MMFYWTKVNVWLLDFALLLCIMLHLNILQSSALKFKPLKITNISCYSMPEPDSDPIMKVDDNLQVPEKSIFFLETSCRGCLNTREACTVESAAATNPDWEVYVLVTGPIRETCKIGKLYSFLSSMKNVRFARIHVSEFTKGTDVEKLYSRNVFALSDWPVVHNSDILRILTLNKFGGLYLDLDMVVIKSFNTLPKNFVVEELPGILANSVLRFSKDGIGKRFTDLALVELRQKFRPWLWTENGPGLIKRIMKKLCYTSDTSEWGPETCQGIKVLNSIYFFPIRPEGWELYFGDSKVNDTISYTHHLWNQLGAKTEIRPNDLYKKLAAKYCPNINKMFGLNFGLENVKLDDDKTSTLIRTLSESRWYE